MKPNIKNENISLKSIILQLIRAKDPQSLTGKKVSCLDDKCIVLEERRAPLQRRQPHLRVLVGSPHAAQKVLQLASLFCAQPFCSGGNSGRICNCNKRGNI